MIQRLYQYPNDPETVATLMFGAEFAQYFRNNEPAQMRVNDVVVSEFSEIICDACNAEIDHSDPCMLINRWLYCWDCAKDKKKYLK